MSLNLLRVRKKKNRVDKLTKYLYTQSIGLVLDTASLIVFFLLWNAQVSVSLMALGTFSTISLIGYPFTEYLPSKKGKKIELTPETKYSNKETNSNVSE